MTSWTGTEDPATRSGYDPTPRTGFFTDTSLCIGCKACEVACKEWNAVPATGSVLTGDSYDNTGSLGSNTWRHVAFIEQPAVPAGTGSPAGDSVDLGMPAMKRPGDGADPKDAEPFRWLMSSDVCKHCTDAACLDVCPTGSLMRTEFGSVVVQDDICNGCGYCIPACPYGVIERRDDAHGTDAIVGVAQKCTLCYDRTQDGLMPACATACPTESIQFGVLDDLRAKAAERVAELHERGVPAAKLYGESPDDGVGGAGAFFLLLDEPEVYGFPPDPVTTTRDLPKMWKRASVAACGMLAGSVLAFMGSRS